MTEELERIRHAQHRAIADGLAARWFEKKLIPTNNPLISHEIALAMDTVRRAGHQDMVTGSAGQLVAPIPAPESDALGYLIRKQLRVVESDDAAEFATMPDWTPDQLRELASEHDIHDIHDAAEQLLARGTDSPDGSVGNPAVPIQSATDERPVEPDDGSDELGLGNGDSAPLWKRLFGAHAGEDEQPT